jgi:hypothetical protein
MPVADDTPIRQTSRWVIDTMEDNHYNFHHFGTGAAMAQPRDACERGRQHRRSPRHRAPRPPLLYGHVVRAAAALAAGRTAPVFTGLLKAAAAR